MKRFQALIAISSAALLLGAVAAGAALQGDGAPESSGDDMVTAAQRFLGSLRPEQAARARYDFNDPERVNWHFIPRERNGLPIADMDGEQRNYAYGLLHTGVGREGYLRATTIMSLEAILRDMENDPVRRNPEGYYFTVFGDPAEEGTWGWRVEGHHLSLNFTVSDGEVSAFTPMFFGANPAEVLSGRNQGVRALAPIEDLAIDLLASLNEEQRGVAIVSDEAPDDLRGGGQAQPDTTAPEGIALGELADEQQELLLMLLDSYLAEMPPDVAAAIESEIRSAGVEQIHFGWWGGRDRREPHYYRIQGPTFLVEFCNTQNNANHIHSVWRSLEGDFGVSL